MWITALIVSASAASTFALSIHYGGVSGTMPFELQYQDTHQPLDVVLQIANSSSSPATILAWQLDLELRPVAAAAGELLFSEIAAPPDGLFGEDSAPQATPPLPPPTSKLFVQDATSDFEGAPLPATAARNILVLKLQATSGAAGEFQLLMPSGSDPEVDSSWMDGEAFAPRLFENAAASDFPGFILLGRIHVHRGVTIHGDYDRDGSVTAADYDRWRMEFGSAVDPPGSAADGNLDGIVDAADFVVWRRHYTPSENASAATPSAPEAPVGYLTGAAVVAALLYRRTPCVAK